MAPATNQQFAVAVHVLTYLAGTACEGRPISSDELAGSVNANPVYIRRALGPLREAGVIRSVPGAGGGWRLCHDPEAITLADVWALLHGEDPVLGLHGANPSCPVGTAITGALVALDDDVRRAVAAELARTTVAELLRRARAEGAFAPG